MSSPAWQPQFLQTSPVFAPLRDVGAALAQEAAWPSLARLNQLLAAHAVHSEAGARVHAVAQTAVASPTVSGVDAKYEARIYRRGELPTRTENWHDLFNLLVWLRFPLTKARLNALHYRELTHAAAPAGNRTRVQDVLTLFDEGGLIVISRDPALLDLLRNFQWKTLFWQRRAQVLRDMRFYLFGHALYEKALAPYKGLTAKAVLLDATAAPLAQVSAAPGCGIDRAVAAWFGDDRTPASTQALAPVPILGIPGWSDDNRHADYYDDSDYFRSGYRRSAKTR